MRPPSVRIPPKTFKLAGIWMPSTSSLANATSPLGGREGSLPHRDGKAAVTVDGPQIKEDIDRQQSSGLERVIQCSTRLLQVATEPRQRALLAITPPLQ